MAKKILVIDDDPEIVKYMVNLFQDNGYQTIAAYDGVQGFDLAKSEKPDLITLDMDMPQRDGTMFYVKFRKEPELEHIPIIVISGIGGRPPAMKKDMVTVHKPFEPAQLLSLVKDFIEKK